MDSNAEINRVIATLYNQGRSPSQISEILNHEHGIGVLSEAAIRSRIQRMKKSGALDAAITSDPALRSDMELIREVIPEKEELFKIGVYDIETTGFYADFGYILCAVFYDFNAEKFDVCRIDETEYYKNRIGKDKAYWKKIDEELVEKIRDTYASYDMIISYNGRRFDDKFINTKLTKYQLPLLPPVKYIDMYSIARYRMRLRSKRLDTLKHFFEMDSYDDGHDWTMWQMAAAGEKKGLDGVVYHCKRDCVRLAELAKKMKSHIQYIN